MSALFLLYREVSWCSWSSHHFYVVRVPGSNPAGSIFLFYSFLLLDAIPFLPFFLRKVSWCSWLSHHLDVVRVPGSNPGGTILFSLLFLFYPLLLSLSLLTYPLLLFSFYFILYTTYYILHLSYLLFTTLFFIYFFSYSIYLLYSIPSFSLKASVAQLVAALDWRSKGHWFEPGRKHSFYLIYLLFYLLLVYIY